jgi:hypothetical protein
MSSDTYHNSASNATCYRPVNVFNTLHEPALHHLTISLHKYAYNVTTALGLQLFSRTAS